MDDRELAWAAGLFEGEGTISWFKLRGRPDSIKVSVALSMTDEDVVIKFANIMGFGKVKGPYQPQPSSRKVRWVWEVQNFRECLKAINILYPYMGMRRAAKADEFINNVKYRLTEN
jgi:hypothetical protein